MNRSIYLKQKVRSYYNNQYYETYVTPSISETRWYTCPFGYNFKENFYSWEIGQPGPTCVVSLVEEKDPCKSDRAGNRGGGNYAGNPIDCGTRHKLQVETDYTGSSTFPLRLQRTYRSANNPLWTGLRSSTYYAIPRTLGAGWRHNYHRFIKYYETQGVATAYVYRDTILPTFFTLTRDKEAA